MENRSSYGQILKSSALVGGSSVINAGFAIIRNKAMALLLGPAGMGLLGNYTAIADLTRTFAGMGVNASGVRQIAEAAGTGDTRTLDRTVIILRRVALCSGALGALLLVLASPWLSRLTFQDRNHVIPIALLGLAVLLGDISAGQGALVQGMRRIGDLALMSILGALFSLLCAVPIVYLSHPHERGIVPSLICAAGLSFMASWWFARKIKVRKVEIAFAETRREVSILLKLGVVLMASGLMSLGVAYLIRVVLTRELGLKASGYYHTAWVLGGYYTSFILQAMGADFYPRLTGVAHDNAACNRLVNEQAEVGLLLAGPGILAAVTCAPILIQLFYSSGFGPSVEVFRWICLGMLLRVVSWPIGFIVLAKNIRKIFFWCELFAGALQVGLAWLGLRLFGLPGTGIAFFASYVVYGVILLVIASRISGFRMSTAYKQILAGYAAIIGLVFTAWYFLPHVSVAILGGVLACVAGVWSLKKLCALVPFQNLPRVARKCMVLLRMAPAPPV